MPILDKVPALVTGAGKRVGRALAEALAADGHPVAVHYNRSDADAADVVAAIEAAGGQAAAVGADLSQETAVADLWHRAGDAIGAPVQLLINNASVFDFDDALSATRDGWDRHLGVNLRAPFHLIQQMARGLPDDRPALAINIIDQRVWRLTPEFMTYTLSKAGLWTLTQTLAQALAPRIRVAAIGPGPVLASIHQQDETFAEEAEAVPLQRGPALDELANAVRFLRDTPSFTGQMLALDGGQHLAWQTPDVVAGRS